MGAEGQSLTAEDQIFVLMQAGLSLTAAQGPASSVAGICYDRAEPSYHLINHSRLLYCALRGQLRFSILTDKMSATMQIAKRVYSLTQELE
jgi:hypothetical protein